jgi:branched-subunit amino acid aminotransferase/4-amino-4-deoxychorismate lyase
MNEAKKNGCDEVIMHNNNVLTEAGASNLFFIKDGDICTPALSNNILPGITRQILIDTLARINIKVYEKDFTLDDLKAASSAWLTSSTKGIAPIIDIINLETNLILNDDMYLIVKKNFDSNFFS